MSATGAAGLTVPALGGTAHARHNGGMEAHEDAPDAPAVARLRALLGREAVARAAGACRIGIVDRWAEGRHRPRGEDARRLGHLAAAVDALGGGGATGDAVRQVLGRPAADLGGRAPLDAIAAGDGPAVAAWAARLDGPAAPVVTVRLPGGAARLRWRDGRIEVEPPASADHPLVAAVAAQMRATAGRVRPRPSC